MNINQGLIDRIATFDEVANEKFANLEVIEVEVGRTKNLLSWQDFGDAQTIWRQLSSRIHNLAGVTEDNLTPAAISESIKDIIPTMNPDQLQSLVEELSEIVTDISYRNFKHSMV